MATIGQQLTQPEQGWKRYDDTHPLFKYIGTWTRGTSSSRYLGSENYSNVIGATITFSFMGTKIRILDALFNNRGENIEITIDGIKETYSSYSTNNTTLYSQTIVYEKTGLNNSIHTVTMALTALDSGKYIVLDAIDIDSTGRLLHPDEVTDIKELEIGKRIRCHYQATTANTVGSFSNLGQETSDFIPVTSSNVPNGDFYFICVDEYNKKKMLIADRNIQHSISWDTLNSAGIASGSGVPVNWIDNSRYSTTIRLLTGGINNTDKDNEWDKYIVGSTLNGSIVAGDNNVWNWSGVYSSSSTSSVTPSNRIVRGNTAVGNLGAYVTNSTGGTSSTFRPVLIIEDILQTHTFIKSNNQYKTFKNNQWSNISATLPSQSIFISDGMQNLSNLDRKETKFKQDMTNNGVLGEGKVFKNTIDLKKLFEITKIEVE